MYKILRSVHPHVILMDYICVHEARDYQFSGKIMLQRFDRFSNPSFEKEFN